MPQRQTFFVTSPEFSSETQKSCLEPSAAGREAFWQGKPVAANPNIGTAAREWTAGWREAHSALATRAGHDVWTLPRTERQRLLRAHRPADVERAGL